jgi:hypothetical protein
MLSINILTSIGHTFEVNAKFFSEMWRRTLHSSREIYEPMKLYRFSNDHLAVTVNS